MKFVKIHNETSFCKNTSAKTNMKNFLNSPACLRMVACASCEQKESVFSQKDARIKQWREAAAWMSIQIIIVQADSELGSWDLRFCTTSSKSYLQANLTTK